MSYRNVAGVNPHQCKLICIQPCNGRPNCELEILYCDGRISSLKLHLQCVDLYPHVICNVEIWLDNSGLDNEFTISSYSLVRLEVVDYCCR